MIDNPSKIITIEDVMDMLAISSKKTIYTYIQREKLHPINKDDWHIEGRYEFDLEDVIRLKEELKSQDLRQKKSLSNSIYRSIRSISTLNKNSCLRSKQNTGV
ncbi:hypothetical protein AAAC51_41115 [Priestia megaterium]